MKCKYCGAELEEGNFVCSACGKSNNVLEEPDIVTNEAEDEKGNAESIKEDNPAAEENVEVDAAAGETSKLSAGKLAVVIVAGIALLAVLVCVILMGLNGGFGSNNQTDGTQDPSGTSGGQDTTAATEEATTPTDGNPDDVTCKGSYTASDEDVTAAMDTVVATFGDSTLTNGELQIYYWSQVYSFYQYYGSYVSNLGLDYTKPLDTQLTPDGMSWQQVFLSLALEAWQNDQAMTNLAFAQNLQLNEEDAATLASVADDLETKAQENNFTNGQEMLARNFGPGCTIDDYVKYMELYFNRSLYFQTESEKINPTDAEIEAYFGENEQTYAGNGLTKDTRVIDVRHILIYPENGTKDESGSITYSDEAWENCRVAAQAILDEWLSGDKTEESFAALANEYSDDAGSNTNGGLYEGVSEGDTVEQFNDWCFDETRVTGDTDLVRTKFGYHVMYYVGDAYPWFDQAKNDLIQSLKSKLVTDAAASAALEVDYAKILLGYVDLNAQ